MTEATTPTTNPTNGTVLPDDGQEATKELHEKAPTEDDDGVSDLLAELCDETLTEAERLENQFALTNRWTIDGGRLESRILRVLKDDPRTTPETENGVPTDGFDVTGLTPTAQDLLAELPATDSELTDCLNVDSQTVRELIATIRAKGIPVHQDSETGTYGYDADDDSENVIGFGSLNPSEPDADDESEEESIYLVYWLPTEDVAVEEFKKPVPWSADEYKFARLVEAIGYGPGTIDQLEGEAVVLDRDGGEWAVPDPAENGIHPAAYTTNPVAPPGTSARSTLAHLQRAVAPKARCVVLNRYTVGAAAFLAGSVAAYGLYVIAAAVIGFLMAFPEWFVDTMAASSESGSDGDVSEAQAEQIMEWMETMIGLMIPLMIIPILWQFMRRMMQPRERY